MGNILAMRTRRKVSVEKAAALFDEINRDCFGGAFTITRSHDTVFDFDLDFLDPEPPQEMRRWGQHHAGFDFYWETNNTITTKWPPGGLWNQWLWTMFRSEYARRVNGWFKDTDDPSVEAWRPDFEHGRFLSYRDSELSQFQDMVAELAKYGKTMSRTMAEVEADHDYRMEGCPPKLLALLNQSHAGERV